MQEIGDTCEDVPGDPPTSTATTSPVSTGEGGAAGHDPGADAATNNSGSSSTLTSDTSAGGTSAGGTSAGGTSAGGTSAGGTSAGGTSAGGTSAGAAETSDAGGGDANTTSSTGSGSGGTGSHVCDSGGCDLRILTSNLGPFCAGAAIEVQLEAICFCDSEEAQEVRSFNWTLEGPDDLSLTLTTDGVLSGALAAGTHFSVTARTTDGAVRVRGDIVIEVVEDCLVIFRSEAATPGQPYLVASRLDTEHTTIVPRVAGTEASVSSFDLTANGRYLAQLEETAAERKLQLFDLLGNQVEHLEEVHVDEYLAHAFSPESHWLAVIEGPADDPAGANLKVFDLRTEPVQVLDQYGIHYEGGLTWSTAHHLLYWSPVSPPESAVHEVTVDDSGLSPPSEYSSARNILAFDPFVRFLVNEVGFLTIHAGQHCFFNRDAGHCRVFPALEALSPDLTWGALLGGEAMELYLLSQVYTKGSPQASIEGCDTILTWAEDESTLLCTVNLKPVVFRVESNGSLGETPLQLTGGMSWQKRVAFSRTGGWLALTPNEEGLVVLPQEEYGTRTLDDVMFDQIANESWDFFFTSDEGRLIVQRGSDLFVARMDAHNLPPTFVTVATDLVSRPECLMQEWFFDPPTWCGAPRFRGNLVVSSDERHLGFVNAGQVATADLAADGYPLRAHGTLAPGCGSECIRFR